MQVESQRIAMPSPAEILAGLTAIANRYVGVAVAWHVLLAIFLLCMLLGWKPNSRAAGALLCLLPVSAAALAWMSGNPFNAAVLGLLTAVLVWASQAHRPVAEARPMPWLGAGVLAYGWVYPHFLESAPAVAYAVASPIGLVPCPTLAVLVGIALRRPRVFSRLWLRALVAAGVFYGAFGVVRLGVWIDIGLVAGALALLRIVGTARTDPD